MMFRPSAAFVFLSASVIALPAFAQQAQPAQPGQPAQPRPGQVSPSQGPNQGSPMINEQSMATCLAIANQEEIAIAEFASEKSKNKDVKEFAQMLIEDHQEFLKKLQRFTPEARSTTLQETASTQPGGVQPAGGAAAQPVQRQPAQQQPAQQQQPNQQIQQTAGQQQGRPAAPVDLVRLDREIAQQCLSDSKKKLGEKDGAKFDACFVGHQIAKHEAMKTKLTVMQRHASGEFAQLLADAGKSVDKHLKEAEKIMDDLVDVKKK